MPTIEQRFFDEHIAEGKPYFGSFMHAFQGAPIRHGYMDRIVKAICDSDNERSVRILEVGSWAGGSAVTWANALKKYNQGHGQVVCVDSWRPYFDPGTYSEASGSVYQSMHKALFSGDILHLFLHNIRSTGNESIVLPAIGASDDVLPLLSDSTFDIVYIDGAHDFKSVKSDLRNASRLVVEGGVLCGDDLEAQLSQVNPRYAEENAHLDFVCDPESGLSYHPGVTLAVAELASHVSCWDGFWALRKEGGRFVPIEQNMFSGCEVTIPEHIPIDELSPPTLVVHGHKGFNVIKYLGSYWGVAQNLGSMDLTAVDVAKIDVYELDGTVRISDTLEGVIESIDGA